MLDLIMTLVMMHKSTKNRKKIWQLISLICFKVITVQKHIVGMSVTAKLRSVWIQCEALFALLECHFPHFFCQLNTCCIFHTQMYIKLPHGRYLCISFLKIFNLLHFLSYILCIYQLHIYKYASQLHSFYYIFCTTKTNHCSESSEGCKQRSGVVHILPNHPTFSSHVLNRYDKKESCRFTHRIKKHFE